LVLVRFAVGGALSHEEGIPLFVIPATFLFVLLVILLAKAPKIGIGLIIALVCMVVVGLLVSVFVIVPGRPQAIVSGSQTHQQFDYGATGAVIIGDAGGAVTVPAAPSEPLSPIWSEGVEQEFEADVYPSLLAAAKALGRRMADPIRTVAGDPNAAVKVILFQENNERSLIAAFGRSVEQELPDVRCSIEADLRNISPGEVGLTFRVVPGHFTVDTVQAGPITFPNPQEGTQVVATAFAQDRRTSAEARFIDKPWVESFGAYASARPGESLIIARSNGTCTSESEANQQALDDTRSRLTEALGRQGGRGLAELGRSAISSTDVLNGGFIVDRFVQSLDGSAGKIWRQAMLLDVSGGKLAHLAQQKHWEMQEVRMSWARMGFSVVGVLALIGVIYFFLNMATRGYYEWSLRIAGVVLAVVAIVAILMIVQ